MVSSPINKAFCQIKGLSFYIYLIEALIKYYQILLRIRGAMSHIRFASLSVLQYIAFGVCCQCPLVVVTLQIYSLYHIRNMLYKSKMVYTFVFNGNNICGLLLYFNRTICHFLCLLNLVSLSKSARGLMLKIYMNDSRSPP